MNAAREDRANGKSVRAIHILAITNPVSAPLLSDGKADADLKNKVPVLDVLVAGLVNREQTQCVA